MSSLFELGIAFKKHSLFDQSIHHLKQANSLENETNVEYLQALGNVFLSKR